MARRLPVEVCENIIDSLCSGDNVREQVENSRILHQCALVCRAWRVRSQRILFYAVVLRDLTALQRFSAVLDAAPHLGEFVYEVILVGQSLHGTASPLSSLPILLAGKLPKLQELTMDNRPGERTSCIQASDSLPKKPLQYISLPPRSSLFLSAFSAVFRLWVNHVTFRCFSDFARMVNSFPALEYLHCDGVRWATLGPLPACMALGDSSRRAAAQPYASDHFELFFVSAS